MIRLLILWAVIGSALATIANTAIPNIALTVLENSL